MRYTASLMIFLLWPAFADAQVVKIVRQVCGPFSCHFEVGSGVVVGRTPAAQGGFVYRILTVYHVCGNRWDMKVKQWVRRNHDYKMTAVTPAGRFPAQIAAWSGDAMLMLLTIDVPAGSPEIGMWEIADKLPVAGDAVAIHGYSHKRNCQYGVRSLTLRTYGPKEFETTSQFEEGESGGPIVKDGKIVGLCEGYDARTKCGLGPSVVAIRWFLNLPPIGSRPKGQSKPQSELPVPPGLSVPAPGAVVPVPPPPAERSEDKTGASSPVDTRPDGTGDKPQPVTPAARPDAGDAPLFVPPDHKTPQAEPDPISTPPSGTLQPIHQAKPSGIGRMIGKGLDIWSMLAGAGIVAGTGGIGGLALLAWRGLRAGRAVAGAVRHWESREIVSPLPTRPSVPLPPQNVNFVEVPMDYRRESVDWALAETGRKYPGAIGTIEVIKSLINQHLQGSGHGPDTLHS